ncbi:protein FAR1-RELATED SEQUENCE 5-like [Silene latifolia]|uniref:protein FAR1-RELATED SEQUENCE 5-like n=1 Tax=Silene latifolia TaxID=37657 RepID=UPI003D786394
MTSFDTTFRKNKYRMIFGPFTGVDHHKRCAIFSVGLIINESKESFAWLFNKFLDAMRGRHQVCLITDKDEGIEEGIELAWKDKVQHRYCIWHILKKLPEKVGPSICKETEFLKEINSCVWGEDVEQHEFEERWTTIVESHGLSKNEWLKEKYGIRQMWIPAYFCDLFLGDRGFKKAPSEYLVSRSSKLATCQPIFSSDGQLLADCRAMDERVIVGTSVADDSGNSGIGQKKDKSAEIGNRLGRSVPSEIKVLPPRQCKNKGLRKRLISQREKAGEVSKKPLRRCKVCGEMANHDSRNCDKRTTDN